MNKINFPQLDGNTSLGEFGNYIKGLSTLLDVTVKMQTEARLSGDVEQESLKKLEAAELHALIGRLSFMPLVGNKMLSLPSIAKESRMIAIDVTTIEEDIKEAQEIKIECTQHDQKEVITARLNSPTQKAKLEKYKERVAEVVRKTQVDGVDLFTMDKKYLKELRDKRQTDPKSMTDADHKALFAADMRQTLCELLGSGGRSEAVTFIIDYLFRPDPSLSVTEQIKKKYSITDAHMLLEALKDMYNITEPSKRNSMVTNSTLLPTHSYLHITYKNKKGIRDTDYVYITKGNGAGSRVVRKVGAETEVCDIKDIVSYRKVNRYEERTTIKELQKAYKKVRLAQESKAPF